jgi:type VI secretion system protein ImpK
MTGDNPFADDDDDLDKTVVRPAAAVPSAFAPKVTPPPAAPGIPGPEPTRPASSVASQGTARVSQKSANTRDAVASVPKRTSAEQGAASLSDPALLGDAALIRDARLLSGASISRLMDAAVPTLALVVAVRDLESHPDPDSLLERAITEIRAFETAALAAGYSNEKIRLARYALCATLDDVVLASPWGGQTAWANRGLVSTIHRETMSGERFYALLDQLLPKATEHLDELQVFYVCLSLGFEGKYRILPRGASELSRVRDRLHRLLTRDGEPVTGLLSPAGLGVAPLGGRFPAGVTPLWFPIVVAAAVMTGLYVMYARDLAQASRSVAGIEARFAQPILRADVPVPPAVAELPPVVVPQTSLGDRLRLRLGSDISALRVEVLDLPQGAAVRIIASDLFPSGGSTVAPDLTPLVERIASALEPEDGGIGVVGHTDSIPMRPNARFADNTELSLARAQAVAALLSAGVSLSARVQVRGMGATMPIADNSTPEGRAANRRVEVLLLNSEVSLDQGMASLDALGGWEQ